MTNADSEHQDPDDDDSARADRLATNKTAASGRWITLLLVALIAIPLVIQWVPTEIAMWKQAAARIAYENGDTDTAFQLSQDAVDWDGNSTLFKLEQARWYDQQQQYKESISLFEQLLSVDSGTTELRMEFCDVLNRHAIQTRQTNDLVAQQWEFIDRWYAEEDRLESLPALSVATYYNNRAYQLAVSGAHLDDALTSINRCIELLGGEILCLYGAPMSHVQGAYQSYKQQKTTQSLERLNKAVRLLEQIDDNLPQVLPDIQWGDSEAHVLAQRIIQFRMMYGEVLFFRALLLRQANDHTAANRDKEKATDLGAVEEKFQPARFSGTNLITPETSSFIGMALDTRGFLWLLKDQPHLAQTDLDQAVYLVENYTGQVEQFMQTEKHRSPAPEDFEAQRKQLRRQLAVILYHRALVFEKLKKQVRAEEDLQRVQKMGFEPSKMLF